MCEKVWVKCKHYKLDKAFIIFIGVYIYAFGRSSVVLKVTGNHLKLFMTFICLFKAIFGFNIIGYVLVLKPSQSQHCPLFPLTRFAVACQRVPASASKEDDEQII